MKHAARIPYQLEANALSISWLLESSYPPGQISPVEYQVFQSAFYDNVSEVLGINLSPFAQDRYVRTPTLAPTVPNGSSPSGDLMAVEIIVVDELIPSEIFRGDFYDGWIVPGDQQIGLSDPNFVRTIAPSFLGYINIFTSGITNIDWVVNGVIVANTAPLNFGQLPTLIPVIKGLTVTPGDEVKVVFWEGGVVLQDVVYNIVCPYEDEAGTIGFVNRYGFWEFFDCVGRSDIGSNKKNESYISAATGNNRTYLTNGNRTLMINTGFKSEGFKNVIEDLLMSNNIIFYNGGGVPVTPLILKNTTEDYKTSRHNKVEIDYLLRFETAAKIIPIV
jgi:hypothetical protein